MKTIIKTTADGWDCIPELNEVVYTMEELNDYIYEIKNCQRSSDLEEIVFDMQAIMEQAIEQLQQIDTDVEIVVESK